MGVSVNNIIHLKKIRNKPLRKLLKKYRKLNPVRYFNGVANSFNYVEKLFGWHEAMQWIKYRKYDRSKKKLN